MKKILSILFLAVALIFVTTISCEDPKPACEQDNTCTVKIKNNTTIALWVDCTEPGSDYNDERRIMPGSTTSYTMTAGEMTVWAASDTKRAQNLWQYSDIRVSQCTEYTFTWNSGKGASEGDGAYYIDDESSGSAKIKK